MRTFGLVRPCTLLMMAAISPALEGLAAAQEAAHERKLEVVTPRPEGILGTAINAKGELVGFQWVERKDTPGVVEQAAILARGKEITPIPVLKGYTATFPAAISDGGRVVGRASKPAPLDRQVDLRNQAFVWEGEGPLRGLGALEGDTSSFATGINRDGRRISGYSVGAGRIRACVWDLRGDVWKGTALPHDSRLGTTVVPISGDGKRVAGVDGVEPCLWIEGADGRWSRELIGEAGQFLPRGVNDSGVVVGFRFDDDGLPHAMIYSAESGCRPIDEPKGFTKSEALGVNNQGVVVGMVDVVDGSKPRSRPFVYAAGKLRLVEEGGAFFESATAINDRGQVTGVFESEEDQPDRKND